MSKKCVAKMALPYANGNLYLGRNTVQPHSLVRVVKALSHDGASVCGTLIEENAALAAVQPEQSVAGIHVGDQRDRAVVYVRLDDSPRDLWTDASEGTW